MVYGAKGLLHANPGELAAFLPVAIVFAVSVLKALYLVLESNDWLVRTTTRGAAESVEEGQMCIPFSIGREHRRSVVLGVYSFEHSPVFGDKKLLDRTSVRV